MACVETPLWWGSTGQPTPAQPTSQLHDGDRIPRVLVKAKAWEAELNRYIGQVRRYAFYEKAPVPYPPDQDR